MTAWLGENGTSCCPTRNERVALTNASFVPTRLARPTSRPARTRTSAVILSPFGLGSTGSRNSSSYPRTPSLASKIGCRPTMNWLIGSFRGRGRRLRRARLLSIGRWAVLT